VDFLAIDGKVYRVMNPLGDEEAAKKNRERLEQLKRPYTTMDTKARAYAKRWYRNRDKKL